MSKHLIRATAIGLGFALVIVASAFSEVHVVRVGNLVLKEDGGISPTKLPRHRQAPISAHLWAELGTTDGSHPPAVTKVTVDFDKDIHVNAKGLPACKRGRLEASTTAAAEKACPDAIVGSGEGKVEVAFPEQSPFSAKGPILLFNGGVRGGTTLLLIHTYVAVPTPTAVTATVKITRTDGRYGLHTVTQVPKIAGGAGSITRFTLRIDRKFTYKGRKQSFLTASCPTGSNFNRGEALFADGTKLRLSRTLPCTPTG